MNFGPAEKFDWTLLSHWTDDWTRLNFCHCLTIYPCAKRFFSGLKMASSSWFFPHPCNHALTKNEIFDWTLRSHGIDEPGWAFVISFTIYPCAERFFSRLKMASCSWFSLHSCNYAIALKKFWQFWCLRRAGQIFDQVKTWPRFWRANFWTNRHLYFRIVKVVPFEQNTKTQ